MCLIDREIRKCQRERIRVRGEGTKKEKERRKQGESMRCRKQRERGERGVISRHRGLVIILCYERT